MLFAGVYANSRGHQNPDLATKLIYVAAQVKGARLTGSRESASICVHRRLITMGFNGPSIEELISRRWTQMNADYGVNDSASGIGEMLPSISCGVGRYPKVQNSSLRTPIVDGGQLANLANGGYHLGAQESCRRERSACPEPQFHSGSHNWAIPDCES